MYDFFVFLTYIDIYSRGLGWREMIIWKSCRSRSRVRSRDGDEKKKGNLFLINGKNRYYFEIIIESLLKLIIY